MVPLLQFHVEQRQKVKTKHPTNRHQAQCLKGVETNLIPFFVETLCVNLLFNRLTLSINRKLNILSLQLLYCKLFILLT
jgi:hypothetical protein